MLISALLVVLGAGSPAQQAAELTQAVEKRMQILTAVARLVRPPSDATTDDVVALRAALSDTLEAMTEAETFAVKNAAALKLSPRDLDQMHKRLLSLDQLLRGLSEPADAPAVAARIAGQQPTNVETEARANLKGLRVAEISYFQERDRYSADFRQIGFEPEGCRGGTHPQVPDGTWIAGCHFIYQVQVSGTCPDCSFEAVAKGVADPVRGVSYKITSDRESSPEKY